jgi:hypothetical protein
MLQEGEFWLFIYKVASSVIFKSKADNFIMAFFKRMMKILQA